MTQLLNVGSKHAPTTRARSGLSASAALNCKTATVRWPSSRDNGQRPAPSDRLQTTRVKLSLRIRRSASAIRIVGTLATCCPVTVPYPPASPASATSLERTASLSVASLTLLLRRGGR